MEKHRSLNLMARNVRTSLAILRIILDLIATAVKLWQSIR